MSDRVLSTETAKASIQKMRQVINGPLIDQIAALDREGTTLSDRNVWDGRLAGEFRNRWPEINSALLKTKQELEDLRTRVQRINDDIMTAGGNV
jgi:uncharacterized protein YukE